MNIGTTYLFGYLCDRRLLLFVVFVAVVASRSNAQNTTSNATLNCRYFEEARSCISNYEDLEASLRGDDEQIATLARSFYRTGKDPTKYIIITYEFQIPSSDSSNSSCVSIERSYIWSTSPVFLLGPRALSWLSLFSISVHEGSVTLRLPCIQETSQRDLLARLTYLIRMYAHGRYVEDLDLNLASKYYFQAQSNSEEDVHYRTIYAVLIFLEILSGLLYAFLLLTTYTWIFPVLKKSKQDLKEKITPKLIKSEMLSNLKQPHQFAKGITSFIALILMLSFRAFAFANSIAYREEVFQKETAPTPSAVVITFAICVTVAYLIVVWCCNKKQPRKLMLRCVTSISISCFGLFAPFVTLAFIQDPLKTFLIITGELMVVTFVYGVILLLMDTFMHKKNSSSQYNYNIELKDFSFQDEDSSTQDNNNKGFRFFKIDVLGWILSAVIVIVALTTVLALYSLGSFQDFDDIHQLLFPVIGTVGTLLVGFYWQLSGKRADLNHSGTFHRYLTPSLPQASWDDRWQPVSGLNWEYRGTHTLTAYGDGKGNSGSIQICGKDGQYSLNLHGNPNDESSHFRLYHTSFFEQKYDAICLESACHLGYYIKWNTVSQSIEFLGY
ncbi:uncharacterized protein [Dysidea avara]|uniref:uncharacterized protein isoform X2 n=1 Tax=Dysidea avara TaxID=196820 RepID=UPI003324CCC7